MKVLGLCQSPTLSDLHLLDIPREEGAVFNMKYIYLKRVDITWEF